MYLLKYCKINVFRCCYYGVRPLRVFNLGLGNSYVGNTTHIFCVHHSKGSTLANVSMSIDGNKSSVDYGVP